MTEEQPDVRAGRPWLWAVAGLLLFGAVIVVLSIQNPGVISEKDIAREEQNLENMHQLARACLLYAEDNGGMLPDSLEQLIRETQLDPGLLYSPFARDRNEPSYELAVQGSIEPAAGRSRINPEILRALVSRDHLAPPPQIADAGEAPDDLADVILIIEREDLRPGPRRFVFLNGTPGSLDIQIGAPKRP